MAYAVPNPGKHQHHFGGSVYSWHYFGVHFKAYHGLIAFAINVIVVVVLSVNFNALGVPRGADLTRPADFEEPAPPAPLPPAGVGQPQAAGQCSARGFGQLCTHPVP